MQSLIAACHAHATHHLQPSQRAPTAPNVCHGLLAWPCLPRRRRPTPIPPRRVPCPRNAPAFSPRSGRHSVATVRQPVDQKSSNARRVAPADFSASRIPLPSTPFGNRPLSARQQEELLQRPLNRRLLLRLPQSRGPCPRDADTPTQTTTEAAPDTQTTCTVACRLTSQSTTNCAACHVHATHQPSTPSPPTEAPAAQGATRPMRRSAPRGRSSRLREPLAGICDLRRRRMPTEPGAVALLAGRRRRPVVCGRICPPHEACQHAVWSAGLASPTRGDHYQRHGKSNFLSLHSLSLLHFTFVRLVRDVNPVLEPGTLTLASLALLSIAMLTWRQGR